MQKFQNNFAFIDAQNVQMGVKEHGWKLDWKRFRVYLKEKFSVNVAYIFLGYIKEYQYLYISLQRSGYILVFKEILRSKTDARIKGNIDAELVLQAMIDYEKYDQAVIVTSDGDFACLVRYLVEKNKLENLLSTHLESCSVLLKKAAQEKLRYLNQIRNKIEYKKMRPHSLKTEL